MKKRYLSYYTRKKIQHRFTQGTFLDHKTFIRFLETHNIRIKVDTLERFEKEGWLQPVFRLVITPQLQRSGLNLNVDGLKAFYNDGLMEFPKKNDYESWSNYKHDYKKGEKHDWKLLYYHPFQIMQVLNILEHKKFNFMYYDSDKSKDIKKKISNIKQIRNFDKKRFKNKTNELTSKIGFLMLLEEPYRFHAFGTFSLATFRNKDAFFNSWIKWTRKTFSPKKMIQQHGLSAKDVEDMHKQVALDAHFLDPLKHWYDLTRIMRPSIINKLKGKSLTAQLYYDMSKMISFLYYDLTKKILREPDSFFDGRNGAWKKNIYSDPFDYATRKTQRGIIRYFVRDPTTRIFFLIEGETEEKVIERIFEKLQVSMKDDGINVINCHGIGNMDTQKLEGLIKTANQDNILMYVLADNEGKSIRKIEAIKKKITTDFNSHIWKKSFEEDNFGRAKVLKWTNFYLQKYGENLTLKEVKAQQSQGKALIKSIENAYSKKYQKSLYRVIKKRKYDFSLELIEPRIKKISRSKKVCRPSEIEKVVDQVFKMVPYWG